MKNRNAGVSLVELLVAISILTILTGIGVYSLSSLSGYRARECAKDITTSLTTNKVTTLGKAKSTGDIYWELYLDDSDGRYYARTVYNAGKSNQYEEVKKMNDGKVSVYKVTTQSGGVQKSLITGGKGHGFIIAYNRSSGAICNAYSPYSEMNINGLEVQGGSKNYSIEITASTGKVRGIQ